MRCAPLCCDFLLFASHQETKIFCCKQKVTGKLEILEKMHQKQDRTSLAVPMSTQ